MCPRWTDVRSVLHESCRSRWRNCFLHARTVHVSTINETFLGSRVSTLIVGHGWTKMGRSTPCRRSPLATSNLISVSSSDFSVRRTSTAPAASRWNMSAAISSRSIYIYIDMMILVVYATATWEDSVKGNSWKVGRKCSCSLQQADARRQPLEAYASRWGMLGSYLLRSVKDTSCASIRQQ